MAVIVIGSVRWLRLLIAASLILPVFISIAMVTSGIRAVITATNSVAIRRFDSEIDRRGVAHIANAIP